VQRPDAPGVQSLHTLRQYREPCSDLTRQASNRCTLCVSKSSRAAHLRRTCGSTAQVRAVKLTTGRHDADASWLNQIEIYFSIVQRKVLTPNDFTDLDDVASRLLAFQDRHRHGY